MTHKKYSAVAPLVVVLVWLSKINLFWSYNKFGNHRSHFAPFYIHIVNIYWICQSIFLFYLCVCVHIGSISCVNFPKSKIISRILFAACIVHISLVFLDFWKFTQLTSPLCMPKPLITLEWLLMNRRKNVTKRWNLSLASK